MTPRCSSDVVAANITGPVFELPAGAVMIAAGAEYRKEQSEEIYSAETQAGNTMGNALSNTIGEYNVREAYIETIVPLLSDAPFARSWEFEAAYRIGDYSTVGTVDSWKARHDLGADRRRPLPRGVLGCDSRAEHRRAVRGRQPDVRDGAGSVRGGRQPGRRGRRLSAARSPASRSRSRATGGFEYTLGDEQSMEGLNLSNPDVKEEKAKTWTVGVVLTPQALRNFTMSID